MEEKIKLLIVDDEEKFLETISLLLERRGFEVTAVASGDAAMKVASEKEFDVALVDLRMPGMNGEQVLEEFRKQHPNMKVVILTGHGNIDSTLRCANLGGFSYLYKPCEISTLVHVLNGAHESRLHNTQVKTNQKTE